MVLLVLKMDPVVLDPGNPGRLEMTQVTGWGEGEM